MEPPTTPVDSTRKPTVHDVFAYALPDTSPQTVLRKEIKKKRGKAREKAAKELEDSKQQQLNEAEILGTDLWKQAATRLVIHSLPRAGPKGKQFILVAPDHVGIAMKIWNIKVFFPLSDELSTAKQQFPQALMLLEVSSPGVLVSFHPWILGADALYRRLVHSADQAFERVRVLVAKSSYVKREYDEQKTKDILQHFADTHFCKPIKLLHPAARAKFRRAKKPTDEPQIKQETTTATGTHATTTKEEKLSSTTAVRIKEEDEEKGKPKKPILKHVKEEKEETKDGSTATRRSSRLKQVAVAKVKIKGEKD
jgi:hypothetical protein